MRDDSSSVSSRTARGHGAQRCSLELRRGHARGHAPCHELTGVGLSEQGSGGGVLGAMNATYELLWRKDLAAGLKLTLKSISVDGGPPAGVAYFLETAKGEISIKPSDVEALMAMAKP